MFATNWTVNGKNIYIEAEYFGDEPWPVMPENCNRNELRVTVDGGQEQTFSVWGSLMEPQFDDEYSLKNIFQMVCDEALAIIWHQEDEMVEGLSFSEAKRAVDSMAENAEKIQLAGLDEDDLEIIVNTEEWR